MKYYITQEGREFIEEGKKLEAVKRAARHIKSVVMDKKPLRSTYKDKERKVGEYQQYGIHMGDKWEKGSGKRKPERRQKRRGYQGRVPNLTGSPLDRYIDLKDPAGPATPQPLTKRRTTEKNRAWDNRERERATDPLGTGFTPAQRRKRERR